MEILERILRASLKKGFVQSSWHNSAHERRKLSEEMNHAEDAIAYLSVSARLRDVIRYAPDAWNTVEMAFYLATLRQSASDHHLPLQH